MQENDNDWFIGNYKEKMAKSRTKELHITSGVIDDNQLNRLWGVNMPCDQVISVMRPNVVLVHDKSKTERYHCGKCFTRWLEL